MSIAFSFIYVFVLFQDVDVVKFIVSCFTTYYPCYAGRFRYYLPNIDCTVELNFKLLIFYLYLWERVMPFVFKFITYEKERKNNNNNFQTN